MLTPVPAGIVPDKSALYGHFALLNNANSYCGGITTIATAGTNSTLTPAQALQGVLRLTSGATGGFTITLPSTAAILGAMGATIPTDGSYSQEFSVLNDAVAQTGTLTAGDASTTLSGTMTVATNTRRDFMVTVTGPTTITIQNIGSAAI